MALAGVQLNAATEEGGQVLYVDSIDGTSNAVGVSKIDIGVLGVVSTVSATNPMPVSVAALPLPSGAATSGKQDDQTTILTNRLPAALGAGGGMKIDGSGTPVPVSGTVTVNAGTNLNTSALAIETGGNLAAIAVSLAILDDWDSSDDCRSIPQSAAVMDGATRCTVKRFRVKCTSGANTLIGAVAAKKFRIRSLAILATSTTLVTVYLSTTTDTGVLGDSTDKLTFDLDGGSGPAGVVLPYNPDGWLETSTVNEALVATLSAAEEVWIIGTYIEVA